MFKKLFNDLSMYRLVLYSLLLVMGWMLVLSVLGIVHYSLIWIGLSWGTIFGVAWISNWLIAKLIGVGSNFESWMISAAILSLIFLPAADVKGLLSLGLVAIIAMVSKFLVVWRKKHLFNPAAFAAVIVSIIGFSNASWWVALPAALPVVLILGIIVAWKLKKIGMVSVFGIVAFLTIYLSNIALVSSLGSFGWSVLGSWPLVFFGLFMFTEPSTTPSRWRMQMIYAVIVGILFGAKYQFGPIYSTPEAALVIGNVFSYVVAGRRGMILKLKSRKEIGNKIFEFCFDNPGLKFYPGQYLEWTLPHRRTDIRGNRRFFTIATSPSEKEICFATKIPDEHSSYKEELLKLRIGEKIFATNQAGDFILQGDKTMVWIAGGVGITPFRSMVKWLIDQKKEVDVVLFYVCNSFEDLAYYEMFSEAAKIGIKLVEVIRDETTVPKGWQGEIGMINEAILRKYVNDIRSRKYYISGPNAMVDSYSQLLQKIGIPSRQVITDFFPGY